MRREFVGAFELAFRSLFRSWCRPCMLFWALQSRQELVFDGGDAFGLCFAGRLFLAQEEGQFVKLCFEGGLGAVAVFQARFELAFA